MGFEHIRVFNRTFDKIKNIKHYFESHSEIHGSHLESFKLEDLYEFLNSKNNYREEPRLIINATPINMLSSSIKWNINPDCMGFDLVYRPQTGTGFLNHFEPHNRIEGIYMLVHQAAPCFKLWFGLEPEIDEGLFDVLFKKMDEAK